MTEEVNIIRFGDWESPSHKISDDDLLEFMELSPNAGWTMSDVKRLCRLVGLSCKPPNGGMHYRIYCISIQGILTIPSHNPIMAPYIRSLVSLARACQARTSG